MDRNITRPIKWLRVTTLLNGVKRFFCYDCLAPTNAACFWLGVSCAQMLNTVQMTLDKRVNSYLHRLFFIAEKSELHIGVVLPFGHLLTLAILQFYLLFVIPTYNGRNSHQHLCFSIFDIARRVGLVQR